MGWGRKEALGGEEGDETVAIMFYMYIHICAYKIIYTLLIYKHVFYILIYKN